MTSPPPFLFSLLNLPLLAGMIMFILIRRPRQWLTWAFAGTMLGLIIYYLADIILYQPLAVGRPGLIWQFIQNQGANLTILAALALNVLLRDHRLEPWEWAASGLIVARMVVDTAWLAGFLRPEVAHPCLSPYGVPNLTCPPGDRLAIATGALAGLLLVILYVSTAHRAAELKRHVLRRYLLHIALLIGGTSVSFQILVVAGQKHWIINPTGPTTLLAILIGLRLFLALEEIDTGIRFPVLGWRILVWLVLLLIAVLLDLTWDVFNAPVWTLVVLAAGMAGGGATLINAWARQVATPQAISDPPSPPPLPSSAELPMVAHPSQPTTALRLYLFGPLRAVRNGETLPNTAEVWRSAKTRSLLAYLALHRDLGVTQVEIVDALWPLGPEPDAEAERSSRSAFRSYLSTLRRVLEPAGPRGSDRWIVHEGERYTLRGDGLWVDVWEFEGLAGQAEAQLAQGHQEEGLARWRQAGALYAPDGLLPDETNLPAEFLEPLREHLRQRWLAGLRRLAKAERGAASAAGLWEAIHQAEPLDQEATIWLVEHYRRVGNRDGLRLLLQRRNRAESDLNGLETGWK